MEGDASHHARFCASIARVVRSRGERVVGARAWGAGAVVLGFLALAACAPNLTTGGGGAGGDGGAGAGSASASSSSSGSGGGGGGGVILCPDVANTPTMVPVASPGGNYCIDSTEVTNAQYVAWVETNTPMNVAQGPECAFNTDFFPPTGALANDDGPVQDIDWCDAFAFCRWYGKRLCGKIGGGSVPYSAINDHAVSQWYNACSRGGDFAYPYGNTYLPDACNGQEKGAGLWTTAGSLATCVGGFPGLFDMSGNVWEWEDACDGSTGENDTCRRRGGGYASIASDLDCPTAGNTIRGASNSTTGFRCCADSP